MLHKLTKNILAFDQPIPSILIEDVYVFVVSYSYVHVVTIFILAQQQRQEFQLKLSRVKKKWLNLLK